MEKLKKTKASLNEEGQEALEQVLDYLSTIGDFDRSDEVMIEFLNFVRYFQAKHILDQAIVDMGEEEG
tara:strand:+ start:3398 stop:3601 length:204 start_codon:yes stop_codon:yes gene_type:complete